MTLSGRGHSSHKRSNARRPPPVGFEISTGGKPERDRMLDGAKLLRYWQDKAFKALFLERQRIIIAPTGSGKSTVLIALGLSDLLEGRADKLVIAVPQSIIASSFVGKDKDNNALRIRLPGKNGYTIAWNPAHQLFQTATNGRAQTGEYVEDLHKFLTRPLNNFNRTNPERILVCTHACLVAYHAKYGKNDWRVYKKVAFNIDEAHHSRFPDDIDEDAIKDDEDRNKLGSFVSDWLKHKPGILTMTTATWFRSDRIAIIPSKQYDSFKRFTYSAHDYFQSLKHLKKIEVRFLQGTPESCVKYCYNEDPRANTIIYTRHSNKAVGRDKLDEVNRLFRATGLKKSEIVDLVDPEDRPQRVMNLNASKERGDWDLTRNGSRPKTTIFALLMGREGFDLPPLQRSIVIGPRESMQVVEQMLGRLTRDHLHKKKVQFNIVLPYVDEDMQDGELIRDYLKGMLSVLALGAIMCPPKFTSAEDKKTFKAMTSNGPEGLGKFLVKVTERVTDAPVKDPVAFVDELMEEGLNLGIEAGEECSKKSQRRVLLAFVRHLQKDLIVRVPDPDVEVQDIVVDGFMGIRSWCLSFGHQSLANMAMAIGDPVQFTWEEGEYFIRKFLGVST